MSTFSAKWPGEPVGDSSENPGEGEIRKRAHKSALREGKKQEKGTQKLPRGSALGAKRQYYGTTWMRSVPLWCLVCMRNQPRWTVWRGAENKQVSSSYSRRLPW